MFYLKCFPLSLLLLVSCSVSDPSRFTNNIRGGYTLNTAGAEFFAIQVPGSDIRNNVILSIDTTGVMTISNTLIALIPIDIQSATTAVYQLTNNSSYLAVLLDVRTNLMFSTNTSAQIQDVEFAFLTPVAVKSLSL